MSDDDLVTIHDARAAGYCAKGVRRRCRELGIDMRRLVRHGIPVAELEALNDDACRRSIEQMRKRVANGKQ